MHLAALVWEWQDYELQWYWCLYQEYNKKMFPGEFLQHVSLRAPLEWIFPRVSYSHTPQSSATQHSIRLPLLYMAKCSQATASRIKNLEGYICSHTKKPRLGPLLDLNYLEPWPGSQKTLHNHAGNCHELNTLSYFYFIFSCQSAQDKIR